ncbi:MAG: acyl-CoA thioesterase [Lachnospiraceae bacterium]|nr:acyl-CoA thioesterase [Lachnospiraceae bacterium]
MEIYKHTVQYYETDKMGITHHSNYIRWMEEARIDFLKQIGWDYARLEKEGIISPVVEVSCKYKKSTTFAEDVFIAVSVNEFKGVKLILSYNMKDTVGNIVAESVSVHCFINESGKPVRLAKEFPELYNVLMELSEAE